MMLVSLLLFSLLTLAMFPCVEFRGLAPEEQLLVRLMNNGRLSFLARPAQNATQTIPVNLGLTLTRIQGYEENYRYVTVSAWMRMSWADYRLKWDPKKYGGVTQVPIPLKHHVWQPDIKLFNGIEPDVEAADVKAVAYHTGEIIWMRPVRFTISCEPEVKDEPVKVTDDMEVDKSSEENNEDLGQDQGPKVRCTAMFGSWTYDSSKIDIRNPALDVYAISENPLFIISDPLARRNYDIYEYTDKDWVDATFSFSLAFRDPQEVFSRVM